MPKTRRSPAPLTALPQQPVWIQRARCRGTDDPDAFFPADVFERHDARAFCATCSVAGACLDYGLRTRQQFGVWGGVTAATAEWKSLLTRNRP